MTSSASRPARAAGGSPAGRHEQLAVAVTGPTGTLGHGLMRFLEDDERVRRVIGIATRPLDPARHGWSKLEYVQADVRDAATLRAALSGVDVVVHLAFNIYGVRQTERTLFDMNVGGTLNVARAALDGGARRFVYASSAAVYGFHARNGSPRREEAPIAAPARHFYARHKAQAELRLRELLRGAPIDAYFFRPCAIVGPHAAGASVHGLSRRARRNLVRLLRPLGGLPVPPPPVPLQFVHEEDAGQAFHLAVTGAGPPGTYNLAGEGALDGRDVVRRLGMRPLPIPPPVGRALARGLSSLPPIVPAVAWPVALSGPVLIDTAAARRELEWRPRFTSAAALDDTRAAMDL